MTSKKSMNIAILSLNDELYSTRRLVEEGEKRGHRITVVDYLSCYVNITPSGANVYYKDEKLTNFDAIIPRISAKRTFYGTAIVRQLETKGMYCINSALSITRARDKLRSLQLLCRKGIGMPITGFAHQSKDISALIKMVGGPPVVIKLLEGTQGVGVVLAESYAAASSVMQTLMGLNANIIVQEFISEANGEDLRCLVIGNKVVASMLRKAQTGEFRANVHQGGSTHSVKLDTLEKETALKASKIIGLNLAGVDILRSKRGPLVLEVNASPGLEGIEAATGKNVAGMIYAHIEKNAKPLHPDKPYHG
jgi:ribosomal protein S6--L-glutamate ligase